MNASSPFHAPQLVNATHMAASHPITFQRPDPAELGRVTVGWFVKVASVCERFWIEVDSIDGDVLTGTICNDLLFHEAHGLHRKDRVAFTLDNAYCVQSPDHDL